MAFGQGTTGLIVAVVISLTSGLAFVICLRELLRELFSGPSRAAIDRVLLKNRDILLDDERTKTFVVEDSVFEKILLRRESFAGARGGVSAKTVSDEWNDRFSYLLTISFLGVVSLAGFVAGISYFS